VVQEAVQEKERKQLKINASARKGRLFRRFSVDDAFGSKKQCIHREKNFAQTFFQKKQRNTFVVSKSFDLYG